MNAQEEEDRHHASTITVASSSKHGQDDGDDNDSSLVATAAATASTTSAILGRILYYPVRAWNVWFYSPVTPSTLRLTAYLRFFLAFIYLYDQVIWTLDRGWLSSPSRGVLSAITPSTTPTTEDTTSHSNSNNHHHHSLLSLAPDSEQWFWTVHFGGIICGIFFLFGGNKKSKLWLLGMYVSLLSFQHDDVVSLPFDMQDDMLRIWCFWFFFLPLDNDHHHHDNQDCAVTKNSSSSSNQQSSPLVLLPSIWPYRLIQLQVIFIYTGTAWGKLLYSSDQSWVRGFELWKAMHTHIFCITGAIIWQPDFVFNKLVSLKVLAWSTLLLEHLALLFIWPTLTTRKWTVGVMVLFHVGIDVTMNMHIFEWVSILGWLFFLARPSASAVVEDDATKNDQDATIAATGKDATTTMKQRSPSPRWLTNPLIAVLILATWSNTNAAILWRHTLPPSMIPALRVYWEASNWIQSRTKPWMGHLGCYQNPWLIFSGDRDGGGHVGYRYYAFIEYKEKRRQSTSQDGNTSDSRVVKTLTWASPNWMVMPWWEQKRHHRTMLFFENMGSADDRATELAAYNGLCRELYLDYNGENRRKTILPGSIIEEEIPKSAMDVVSITLHLDLSEGPSEPPHNLGPWDTPAIRQDLIETTSEDVYYYSKEADLLDKMDCTRRAKAGQCIRQRMARFMWENCVGTCSSLGYTNTANSVHEGTSIVFYGERDINGPYRVIRKDDEGFFHIRHEESGENSKVDLYVKYFGILDSDDKDSFDDADDLARSCDKETDGMCAQVASARIEEL